MGRRRLDSPILTSNGLRRQRRRRPKLAVPLLAGLIAFFLIGSGSTEEATREAGTPVSGPARAAAKTAPSVSPRERRLRGRRAELRGYGLARASGKPPIESKLEDAPAAGLLFDVDSGEVLWQRHPRRTLPIASLTKMMTALIIAERHKPSEKVEISKRAVRTTGSKVGVLPQGQKVRLDALLNGLLLVSGNDTAVALAEHDAGTVPDFVARMNRRARLMELRCTRFSSPHGLADRGNGSCPRDLAAMARAVLDDEWLAEVVGTDRATFDFPVEGGSLELFNNNPLMRIGRPGITGVKTGYTDAAGRCYVTTAKRDGRHLGVVLLDSPDPVTQIDELLERGLKAEGKR